MDSVIKLECQSSPTSEPAEAKCVRDYIDIIRSWKPEEVTEKISPGVTIIKENISRRV